MAVYGKKKIFKVAVNPVIDTAIYAAGDAMHTGAIRVQNCLQYNDSGRIVGVTLTNSAIVAGVITMYVFASNPSGSTITANAALNIVAADLPKLLGHINIAAADYEAFSATTEATVVSNLAVKNDTDLRDLYVVLKIKSGTPTYASTTGLNLNLLIEQD